MGNEIQKSCCDFCDCSPFEQEMKKEHRDSKIKESLRKEQKQQIKYNEVKLICI